MSSPAPWSGRRLHFVGVGGAGMSGYARAARALGAQVSGSDRVGSPALAALAEEDVLVAAVGHAAENLPRGDDVEVIYSSAVPADNPERTAARHRGLAERPRSELLREFSALRRTIAVAGAHGKTTTASMTVHALEGAGLDPSWLVGSAIGHGRANAHWGSGDWLVVEADESDRSMLALTVEVAVLTNVELDHHASYRSLEELRGAFRSFLAKAPEAVIWDRPDLLELRHGPVVPYDVSPQLTPGGSRFRWRGHDVELEVPGAHNALNAIAALEAARLAGAEAPSSIAGVQRFRGAGRRFQTLGRSSAGALLIDDYAHHPTEVSATLQAARTLGPRRLVAAFQPHLYSRTAALARDFGRALALADVIAVLDVYAARERAEDFPGISGLTVAEAAADFAGGRPVLWLPTFAQAEPVLRGLLEDADLYVGMGAGNIHELSARLADARGGARP